MDGDQIPVGGGREPSEPVKGLLRLSQAEERGVEGAVGQESRGAGRERRLI